MDEWHVTIRAVPDRLVQLVPFIETIYYIYRIYVSEIDQYKER